MKVLYVGNFLNNVDGRYDGPNVQVVKILQDQGHIVHVSGTSVSQLLRMFKFLLAIVNAKFGKTDIIIIDLFSTRAFYFAVVAASFSRFMKMRYALVLHGGNLPYRFKVSRALSKRLLEGAALVSSPSNYLAAAAKTEFDVSVEVIPNRIDVSPSVNPVSRKNKLFWVRSLSSIYNPEMAVEVLRKLTDRGLDFKLIFVGPGDASRIEAVEGLVADYNLGDRVEIKGRMSREKWHSLARDAKYFLNTTYVDNTPSSVIEAMALGLILISTNVGGIPFILEDGSDSVLVEPNDIEAMAQAIEQIERDKQKQKNLRGNARSKFESIYAPTTIASKWGEALNSVRS